MNRIVRKRRFWAGSSVLVGAAVALTSVDSAVAEDTSGDFPGGTIDKALHKIFANEGGENGLGFTPLEQQPDGKWSFSVPALNESQLEQAVTGNTFAREYAFAVHMAPSGQYEGWQRVWHQAELEDCPSEGSAKYPHIVNGSGECWLATEEEITGSWEIRGDQLCLDPVPVRLADAQCNRVTLVLNSAVLWDENGNMFGKGTDLREGKSIRRDYLD